MKYIKFLFILVIIIIGYCPSFAQEITHPITPNDFKGTDTERIRAAIDSANKSTNLVVISHNYNNGSNYWMIDSAILLPSNITIVLKNCTLQLSDSSRDNMFRSNNVGLGFNNPVWNHGIKIIGVGSVVLKGANNPRATGDGFRTLSLFPDKEKDWRVSYGSDAGKADRKQKGDWRNIMILMAYVKGFKLKNVTIKKSHAWAISCERVHHATLSDIRFFNFQANMIDGKRKMIANRDAIDLRQGCKYFRIDNITGINGDDLIALSNIDMPLKTDTSLTYYHTNGDINSYQVTTTEWRGPEDDIEQIFITNCKTNYTGVGIRASGKAGIHDVFINGVTTRARPDIPPPYGGSPYTLLVGNNHYGDPGLKDRIYNIFAMNLTGDGKTLISIKSPISNCTFMNGIYTGNQQAITYSGVDKTQTKNIKIVNIIKTPSH